jgi:hypothetical protein
MSTSSHRMVTSRPHRELSGYTNGQLPRHSLAGMRALAARPICLLHRPRWVHGPRPPRALCGPAAPPLSRMCLVGRMEEGPQRVRCVLRSACEPQGENRSKQLFICSFIDEEGTMGITVHRAGAHPGRPHLRTSIARLKFAPATPEGNELTWLP